jgi:signal peptidase I
MPFAVTLAVLGSFRSAVADWNVVPSGSMNPTIVEGDRIFVNKLAYGLRVPFTTWYVGHWAQPQRGEVVVFRSPADGERLVKRVAALPGETVELRGGRLFVNGLAVPWPHPVLLARGAAGPRRDFGPVTVPADHYFMLGDNRDNSADSRYFGFVPRHHITGRSSSVVLSFDPDTHLPRWDRTLHALP